MLHSILNFLSSVSMTALPLMKDRSCNGVSVRFNRILLELSTGMLGDSSIFAGLKAPGERANDSTPLHNTDKVTRLQVPYPRKGSRQPRSHGATARTLLAAATHQRGRRFQVIYDSCVVETPWGLQRRKGKGKAPLKQCASHRAPDKQQQLQADNSQNPVLHPCSLSGHAFPSTFSGFAESE